MSHELSLLKHQIEFISDTSTRNLALIGGYGCGKTKALAVKLITLAFANPGYEGIALSPTYKMANKVLCPTICEELDALGIKYKFSAKGDMVYHIQVGGGKVTKIHTIAAETFARAAGLNVAFFGVDEADLLPTDTFIKTWQMMSSRMRRGKVYQGVAVSTPEGFKGCHKFWVSDVAEHPKLAAGRRIIHGCTYDNPFLEAEYIQGLEDQYVTAPHLIEAYLRGQFVNLDGKPVYWKFDKEVNLTDTTLDRFPNHVLHIGNDFNKGINATVVSIISNNKVFAVDEIYGANDTQQLANEIKKRYPWHFENNAIRFYPDASGFEGIQNLKRNFPEYGIDNRPNFRMPSQNGRVEKRIAAVNEKFRPTGGSPEAFVNAAKCPNLFKGLVQQTFDKNGAPDKSGDIDHAVDAFGYFMVKQYPLTGNVSASVS